MSFPQSPFLYLGQTVVAGIPCGQPVFRGEFVTEDFILLLAPAGFVVPPGFRRLMGLVINCLMTTTIALIVWTTGAHKFPFLLALLGENSVKGTRLRVETSRDQFLATTVIGVLRD